MAWRSLAISVFFSGGLWLTCASPSAKAADIALSLVHGTERIDVPRSELLKVEGFAFMRMVIKGTNEYKDYPWPSVQVCFTPRIQERICDMTRRSINDTIAIVVDCQTIIEPVIREPLCSDPCFDIRLFEIEEVEALIDKLENGSAGACDRPTS